MKYIFISDQGHRKDTSGKNANGLYEYEFNQDVAERVNKLLESYGEVYFTMTTENHPYNEQTSSGRTKNLQYRCDVANNIYKDAIKKYGKDNVKCVLVSIHANAFDNPSASGYEIYVYKKSLESYKIAQSIHNSAKDILEVGTSIKDRGIKEANFYVLKHTSMSSLLIEHEFYTNPEAVKKLKDDNFRQKCAEHIAKGLCNYYGIEYKEPHNNNKDKENNTKNDTDELYRVQVGAFSDKKNAEKLLDKLDKIGFKGFIDKAEIEKKEDKKEEVKENKVETPIVKGDDNLKLEYKGLVKKGSRGNNVKELQEILNKLGYNCGNADGIAGNNTITQIKNLQKDCGLVSDGMAGQATYNKINELLSGRVDNKVVDKPKTSGKKSKYYKKGNVHIIETTPDNIEIKILGDTLHNAGVWGVNGTFFDTPRPQLAKSCWGIATNNGKAIGGNSMLNSYNKSIKRGTLVYYKDGTMDIVRVNSINEFKKPHIWSIGGYSVYPYMNFKEEKMPNGINYRTAHTFLGIKDNKVFLMVKPNCMIKDIIPLAKEMKLEKILVVDGGGSSQLRHLDGSFKTSRKINSAVLLKEV